MHLNNVIVIGASAGGVEVLSAIVAELPPDLPAAVFVVLHTSPTGPGRLPAVLQRTSRLPVSHAVDGELVRPSRVYVAPPDHHMVLDDSHVRVTRGPKENHTRPAVDPLFRSAARAYGSRVIAVVLTGTLDDGAAGLCDVKERGGLAVVQDPADALFPDMPRNAIARSAVDYVVPREEIPALIIRLVTESRGDSDDPPVSRQLEIETRIALEENALRIGVLELGSMSPFTCPECHGVLLHVGDKQSLRFRCHTGHAFSATTLLQMQARAADEALWTALRALEEEMMLLGQLQKGLPDNTVDRAGLSARVDRLLAQGEAVRRIALEKHSEHHDSAPT